MTDALHIGELGPVLDAPQQSAEWFDARLGKVTASRVNDVVGRQKNGNPYAAHDQYRAELLTERLTGVVAQHYVSDAMQRGSDLEEAAALEYVMETGRDVAPVGFVAHPTIAEAGASPDRLVGDDGLLEIKCPGSQKHLAMFLGAQIDAKYWWQMQWQMECTGRAWCDFMSYDPRFAERSPHLVSYITRVHRDDDALATARERVTEFLELLAQEHEQCMRARF